MDGRVARGQKVRDAILRAMLDLIQAGNLRPTSPEIAKQAHVSLRAVFNHFKDAEGLRAAAFQFQAREEAQQLLTQIPPDRPLGDRIEAYADEQAGLLEAVAPFRRAANVFEPFSPEVGEGLRLSRERTRKRIEEVFKNEFASLDSTHRRELLAMLVLACSWPAWDTLRTTLKLSSSQARNATAELLRRIFQPMLLQTKAPSASN
ncbi:MAG: TetR/AcrR family transcriptional regulator [Candidatus Binataceae bacterium]